MYNKKMPRGKAGNFLPEAFPVINGCLVALDYYCCCHWFTPDGGDDKDDDEDNNDDVTVVKQR